MIKLFFRACLSPKNSQERFLLLAKIGKIIQPDFLFGWNGYDWQRNNLFNQVMKKYGEDRSYNLHRRFTVTQLLRLTEGVPGDTAECGVYYGADSELIAQAIQQTNKTHHVFDSFQGMSLPSDTDKTSAYWEQGDMAVSLEVVKKNLDTFKNISFYQGWIPERFIEVSDRNFSFVHIDVDLEQPTRDSIEFFYPRMSPGGIIVCDDYGFTTCPGATKAINDFLKDKPEKMVSLANGGGFLIKNTKTSEEVFV